MKSLNMAGNPLTLQRFKDADFRTLVAAYLPHLVYYEYTLIAPEEKVSSRELHFKQLEILEDEERKEFKAIEKLETQAREQALYAKAYVQNLDKNQLFESLFENDPDAQATLLTGPEAEEIYEDCKEQMFNICQQLFKFGQQQLALREEEMRQYQETINNVKGNSYAASRLEVENYLEDKTAVFIKTKCLLQMIETQNVHDDQIVNCAEDMRMQGEYLHEICQELWTKLMGNELVLYDQMEELNTTFERNLVDMVNAYIELAQGYFTQLRDQENTFSELITDHVIRYQTHLTIRNEDLSTLPPQLRNMMVDKDTVHSAMQASHDSHLYLIDSREDSLVQSIREWCSNLCAKMQNDEVKRNRAAILEINHFLDFQRDEFEELHSKLSDEYLGGMPEPITQTEADNMRHTSHSLLMAEDSSASLD